MANAHVGKVLEQHAIDSLGMGSYMKIFLKFDSPWWVKSSETSPPLQFQPFIGVVDQASSGVKCIIDYYACKGVPVLLAIAPMTLGKKLHSKSDDEIIELCMDSLKKISSDERIVERPTSSYIVRWDTDEFALGAYSFLKYGAKESDCEALALAEAQGRVFFAGEGTSFVSQGSLHGAIITGQEQACNIVGSLKSTV